MSSEVGVQAVFAEVVVREGYTHPLLFYALYSTALSVLVAYFNA